jgi:hypothetical protein
MSIGGAKAQFGAGLSKTNDPALKALADWHEGAGGWRRERTARD